MTLVAENQVMNAEAPHLARCRMAEEEARDFLVDRLGCTVEDLPTLPDAAIQIAGMKAHDDHSADELANIVVKDPSMSSQLLKQANSACYAHMAEIDSVQRAIVILGFEETRNLALTIAAFRVVGSKRPMRRRFLRSELWDHSQFVAKVCEALGEHELGLGAGHYLHGLIHDIGKVVLDVFMTKDFDQVLDLIDRDHIPWCQAEREVMGVDHCQVGAALLNYWKFPPSLSAAAGGHHEPWNWDGDKDTAGLVFLGDLIAHVTGRVSFSGDSKVKVSQLSQGLAGPFLREQGWLFDELMAERIKERVREMEHESSSPH